MWWVEGAQKAGLAAGGPEQPTHALARSIPGRRASRRSRLDGQVRSIYTATTTMA